jgi:hypothetical protein
MSASNMSTAPLPSGRRPVGEDPADHGPTISVVSGNRSGDTAFQNAARIGGPSKDGSLDANPRSSSRDRDGAD